MSSIRFRPHHFLCTLGFEGKGYSPAFVENFAQIASQLRDSGPAGEQTQIEVVGQTDSICQPCPNRVGKDCQTEAKIQRLDAAHAKILGLAPGDTLSWEEAKTRIAERVSVAVFDKICGPCSWRALGVCKAALLRLKETDAHPVVDHDVVGLALGGKPRLGRQSAAHERTPGRSRHDRRA